MKRVLIVLLSFMLGTGNVLTVSATGPDGTENENGEPAAEVMEEPAEVTDETAPEETEQETEEVTEETSEELID